MNVREFNFDGIVGPTHNYSGLSFGNVASEAHKSNISHPRAAALQGLQKMKFVRDLGIGQCVLPPLLRPNVKTLRDLGFSGNTDAKIVENAYQQFPFLVAACFSASNMWTANAATVSASANCADGRVHITTANLSSKLHRSIELDETRQNLSKIFNDESCFAVHDPLPPAMAMSDEGAANHMRVCPSHGDQALEIFVWGRSDFGRYESNVHGPVKFPARQTLESFETISRRHLLSKEKCIFVQQSPFAIDAGVFHNDVISVANENVLLTHESAFADRDQALSGLTSAYQTQFDQELFVVELKNEELPIQDAVSSYLFNSQLLSRPNGGMTLLCPNEVLENTAARKCTDRILSESNPIDAVEFMDLRQSMNNGGGPACLRLRVVLNEQEQNSFHQGVVLTDNLTEQLSIHFETYYREDLAPKDLTDPLLLDEARAAHDDLKRILELSN